MSRIAPRPTGDSRRRQRCDRRGRGRGVRARLVRHRRRRGAGSTFGVVIGAVAVGGGLLFILAGSVVMAIRDIARNSFRH